MKNSRSWLGLLGFGAAVAAAGWFGSRYSPRDTRTKIWYNRLDKSPLTPPNYVFPVVWTALYSLMAIGGWRVWMPPSASRTCARRPATGFMLCVEIAKVSGHCGSTMGSASALCGLQWARKTWR